jgi:hypothetical protein
LTEGQNWIKKTIEVFKELDTGKEGLSTDDVK